jgi:hypothetical protein
MKNNIARLKEAVKFSPSYPNFMMESSYGGGSEDFHGRCEYEDEEVEAGKLVFSGNDEYQQWRYSYESSRVTGARSHKGVNDYSHEFFPWRYVSERRVAYI